MLELEGTKKKKKKKIKKVELEKLLEVCSHPPYVAVGHTPCAYMHG